jgi:F420-non-reducing hydrogenase iron-sulfur subunit
MKTQSIQISMFYCSNSLREDELGSICSQVRDIEINSISLPCSGKVNLLYLLKAIETGSDGVLVVSCRLGDCRYLQGNYRAQKRVHFIDDLLHETGFKKGHILFVDPQEEDKIDTIVSAIEQMVNSFRIEFQQVQK